MEDHEYVVFALDVPMGTVSITLIPGAGSRMHVDAPLDGRPEIGHYLHELDRDRIAAARERLRDSGYRDLPEPEPSLPTMPFLFMGEGEAGAPPRGRAFPLDPLPPALEPVLAEVRALTGSLAEHPHRVLRAEGRWERDTVTPGEEAVLHLELRNVGRAPLRATNPAGARAVGELGMSLRLTRPDGGGGDEGPGTAEVAIPPEALAELLPDGRVEGASRAEVELDPDRALRLRARLPILLEAGAYRASLLIRTRRGDRDPDRTVAGVLAVDPGPLRFAGAHPHS